MTTNKIYLISNLFLLIGILAVFSCKTSTTPQPADCEPGYHQCENDNTICCIDTTSHNFTWEIFTLGQYGSTIRDVTIVNEDNIWVVGNFETDDGEYNAAHWDGNEWELMGFYSNTLDLYSIYYFSEDDIWVSSHGYPIHWNGNEWILYHLHNLGINASAGHGIWGTSSSNIYFIGEQGAIVHYDGINFVQIPSGTSIELNDIDGTDDGEYVFIAGREDSGESIALMIHDNNVETLYEGDGIYTEPYGFIKGISVKNDTAYFASHQALWKSNFITDCSTVIQREDIFSSQGAVRRIRTQQINDISIMTIAGEFVHYNGVSWVVDNTVIDYFGPANVFTKSLSVNNDMVAIAGYCCGGGHAVVALGYRQ